MDNNISEKERIYLDELFNALAIVAEGSYVYLCDMRHDYSRWSKEAIDTFGLPGEYMYGAGEIFENLIHPEDRDIYRRKLAAIFGGDAKNHDIQYRVKRPNSDYDLCTCKGIVINDETGEARYFAGIIRNHGIHGHVDVLTGLRNQYGFFEDLKYIIGLKKTSLITMIGISRFAEINEVYGYHFGNRVLTVFGRFLLECVGSKGSVYRLDGTKFVFISEGQTPQSIRKMYESIRSYFRNGVTIDGKDIYLELNAGLLTLDNFSVSDQTVYACLNYAYGESKVRRQGDLVEFLNDLTDENRQRLEKIHVIRESITRGYEGFYLLYQPVIDAKSEKIIGAEALLRWKSEEYGVVPPDHFIPLLERDPLFPELGRWILVSSLTTAKKMMSEFPDFIINVNLSYSQIEKPEFVDMVIGILEELSFPADHLCLEITERCRLLDMDLLKNVIVNLRGRGVKIALDDFGTGFSSIGLVKNLPFDTIKIDRTFVIKIEDDEKSKELMNHFTGVASTFGANVCVEGVETAGMRDILQAFNVQSFQGYYYAKPLGIGELLEWDDARR